MSGVVEPDNVDIVCHQLHLGKQSAGARLFSGDRQHRHGQLGLRHFGKVRRGLRPFGEICPARPHPAGTRVRFDVCLAVHLRKRSRFVSRQFVPEISKVDLLPSLD